MLSPNNMSIADRQKLYQDYISHYEARSHEGNVTLCDHQLECRGDTQLCDSPPALAKCYSQLIRLNIQSKTEEHRVEVLKKMVKGFAILELICVNLFLFPWRKEIRTLKKFTGSFVYFVEPVIPEDIIRQILKRVGYSVASDTEYAITGKINTEEAKQTSFELYLARIQCEKMVELMNEDRSASVSLLVSRPSIDANPGSEHPGQAGINTSRITVVHEINGVNHFDFQSMTSNNETTRATDSTTPHPRNQDIISDTSKKDPCYYIKHTDSDEFLEKYSDLNLARQPIFPLHIKQNKPREWTAPVSVEPNFKIHMPEPIAKSGSVIAEDKDLPEKVVTYGLQSDNIDVRTFTDNLEPPKSLMLNEPPAEAIIPTKQERVVTKLKMQNVSEESLAYPIEETLPPVSEKFSNSSDVSKMEVKWTFPKTNEGTESFASPMSLCSDFSMLNISSKSPIWTPVTDSKLREPPNSTYIPPMPPKSEFMRSTNIKPEEDHFQAPSPPGRTLFFNDFNIDEDTKEDYVMISRKDHPQD